MKVEEFLGAQFAGDAWLFDVPLSLHGAFGGAFGGVVAACAIVAARSVAPGRQPVSLDCRFVRGLPAGEARAVADVVHAGRTLSTVSVDITGPDGRLATRATVSLAASAPLARVERAAPPAPGGWTAHGEGKTWGTGAVAPIVQTLQPRTVGSDERGIATSIVVPFEPGAEAVCMAADLCVGPPVGFGVAGERVLHPNPDLGLRFVGRARSREVVGVGRLVRATGGVAPVAIEVWCDGDLVAIGESCCLLLPA